MQTREAVTIDVPYPDAERLQLRISVGACRLIVTPAEQGAWITGTYDDPSGGLAAKIVDEGNGMVRITQKSSISAFKTPFSGAPRLELKLGTARPFSLIIETGAADTSFDLGGMPITRLGIKKGAGRSEFDFSAPNPAEMEVLDIDAGAVTLVMKNLANANFAHMRMEGGAATYDFDFDGALQREADVKLSSGVSTLRVQVPATTAARIKPGSVLGTLDVGDGLTKMEGAFWTAGAVAGQKPVLDIAASVALGALSLRVT